MEGRNGGKARKEGILEIGLSAVGDLALDLKLNFDCVCAITGLEVCSLLVVSLILILNFLMVF